MEINFYIQKYKEHIESKSNEKLTEFVEACEFCKLYEGDRWLFDSCLYNQGLTAEQIAIMRGISKQAVHKYFKDHKRSLEDHILGLLEITALPGMAIAKAVGNPIERLYPIFNKLEKAKKIKSFWGTDKPIERGGKRRRYYQVVLQKSDISPLGY